MYPQSKKRKFFNSKNQILDKFRASSLQSSKQFCRSSNFELQQNPLGRIPIKQAQISSQNSIQSQRQGNNYTSEYSAFNQPISGSLIGYQSGELRQQKCEPPSISISRNSTAAHQAVSQHREYNFNGQQACQSVRGMNLVANNQNNNLQVAGNQYDQRPAISIRPQTIQPLASTQFNSKIKSEMQECLSQVVGPCLSNEQREQLAMLDELKQFHAQQAQLAAYHHAQVMKSQAQSYHLMPQSSQMSVLPIDHGQAALDSQKRHNLNQNLVPSQSQILMQESEGNNILVGSSCEGSSSKFPLQDLHLNDPQSRNQNRNMSNRYSNQIIPNQQHFRSIMKTEFADVKLKTEEDYEQPEKCHNDNKLVYGQQIDGIHHQYIDQNDDHTMSTLASNQAQRVEVSSQISWASTTPVTTKVKQDQFKIQQRGGREEDCTMEDSSEFEGEKENEQSATEMNEGVLKQHTQMTHQSGPGTRDACMRTQTQVYKNQKNQLPITPQSQTSTHSLKEHQHFTSNSSSPRFGEGQHSDQDSSESDVQNLLQMKRKQYREKQNNYDQGRSAPSMCMPYKPEGYGGGKDVNFLKASFKPREKNNYVRQQPNQRKSFSQLVSQQERERPQRKRSGSGGRSKKPSVIFELISPEYISLRFQNYMNQNIVNRLKQLMHANMSTWLPDKKQWQLHRKCYDELLAYIVKEVKGSEDYNSEDVAKNHDKMGYNQTGGVQNASMLRNFNGQEVVIESIPDFVFNLTRISVPFSNNVSYDPHLSKFKYELDEKTGYTMEKIPKTLKESLFPFQLHGVEFGVKKHGRFLLGDEMGVGKTIQALSVAVVYARDWPMVIICPKSLKLTWKQEISKWLPMYADEINLIDSSKDTLNDQKIHIMSYEIAVKFAHQFLKKGVKVAICDEVHYLKCHKSKRSQTLIPILTRMKRLMLLSGTPMLARPVELFNALKMLRPDIFHDFFEYVKRYCDPKEGQYGWEYSGAAHTKELHYLLEDKIMIRRLKKHVLSQLPPKLRQKIPVITDSKLVRQIAHILKRNLNNDSERRDLETAISKRNKKFQSTGTLESGGLLSEIAKSLDCEMFADAEEKQLIKAYKLSGEAKIKGILEYIDTMLETEEKFILFAHHQAVLNAVDAHLREKKTPLDFIRIDGNTKGDLRQQYVNKFQNDDQCKIALLSITAASLGLTMTAASTVIFAEAHWTPALMMQAEDRCHRIGQTASHINIIYLYGEGTLDEILFPMVQFKNSIVSETLDAEKSEFKIKKGKSQCGRVDSSTRNATSDIEDDEQEVDNIISANEMLKIADSDGFIAREQDQIDESDDDFLPDLSKILTSQNTHQVQTQDTKKSKKKQKNTKKDLSQNVVRKRDKKAFEKSEGAKKLAKTQETVAQSKSPLKSKRKKLNAELVQLADNMNGNYWKLNESSRSSARRSAQQEKTPKQSPVKQQKAKDIFQQIQEEQEFIDEDLIQSSSQESNKEAKIEDEILIQEKSEDKNESSDAVIDELSQILEEFQSINGNNTSGTLSRVAFSAVDHKEDDEIDDDCLSQLLEKAISSDQSNKSNKKQKKEQPKTPKPKKSNFCDTKKEIKSSSNSILEINYEQVGCEFTFSKTSQQDVTPTQSKGNKKQNMSQLSQQKSQSLNISDIEKAIDEFDFSSQNTPKNHSLKDREKTLQKVIQQKFIRPEDVIQDVLDCRKKKVVSHQLQNNSKQRSLPTQAQPKNIVNKEEKENKNTNVELRNMHKDKNLNERQKENKNEEPISLNPKTCSNSVQSSNNLSGGQLQQCLDLSMSSCRTPAAHLTQQSLERKEELTQYEKPQRRQLSKDELKIQEISARMRAMLNQRANSSQSKTNSQITHHRQITTTHKSGKTVNK